MDTVDLQPQVEALADNIDDLEEALGPLLRTALSSHASKLPLLDKAKLYTLVTYAIESILFSYLSLNGVKAKEHAVFTELTRVRQYFQKIKQVEEAPIKPNQSLDKAAANRFIRAGLAGNEQYDKERALRQAKERAMASLKLEQLNKKRKAEDAEESKESTSSSSSEPEEEQEVEEPKSRKSKRAKAADMWEGDTSGKKDRKKGKKGKKQDSGEEKTEEVMAEGEEAEAEEGEEAGETSGTRKQKSSHVPLGHKAAFQALLQGPIPKREEPKANKKKGKGKRKSKA
ncbi:Sas10/Utp3/C1D [Macrophomina phaseolina MS6]|uniref:Exosome complex protein n=1 Tax=Macrophomina phaseolina (strain MS6) TaxID=1126212 RepID=K2RFQ4_MACPH|nr:Sas10/Utp3/C1D [Macrophomina phaseolina MS6]